MQFQCQQVQPRHALRLQLLQLQFQRVALAAASATLFAACSTAPLRPGDYHLTSGSRALLSAPPPVPSNDIPAPVNGPLLPPPPRNTPRLDTFSVVVSQVEISDLLFALARDAKVNLDLHPGVRGTVSINAIDQTLPQILSRLAKQVDLRYELEGKLLTVMPDTPFVRHYAIDYVNMTRDSSATTAIATQIAAAGGAPSGQGGGGGSSQGNSNSTTQIVNQSNNRFWERLVSTLRGLLGETDAAASEAPASEANASGGDKAKTAAPAAPSSTGDALHRSGSAVIASPETSMVSVRTTARQHERIREYIDKAMNVARRQVLIEATIAEVQLFEEFQQGINWNKLRLDGTGWGFTQQPGGTLPLPGTGTSPLSGPGGVVFPTVPTPGSGLAGGADPNGGPLASLGVLRYLYSGASGNIGAVLSLLQSFGKVKVLSSPKVSVLNNQSAVLKVVDNRVYFTFDVQVEPATATSPRVVTYTSQVNTLPVGFVMSVMPQIEESGMVTMNIRPTISRIIGFVNVPNPAVTSAQVVSRVPEIQTREIESILRVSNGDIAVMGGLMQESVDDRQDAVPGPANVPLVGNLFRYRSERSTKSELVIFLRPIVVRDASIEGDYRGMRNLLPRQDFFQKPDDLPMPRAWRLSDASDASESSADKQPGKKE